jgi:Xaa-Pro aminopeptidase
VLLESSRLGFLGEFFSNLSRIQMAEQVRQAGEKMVQRDMVLTIEPSVTSKFGTCNLEQDVLVTSNGCRELSKPQEAII